MFQLLLNNYPKKDIWVKFLSSYFLENGIKYKLVDNHEKVLVTNGPAIALGLLRGSDVVINKFLENNAPFYFIDHPYVWDTNRKIFLKTWKRIVKNKFYHNQLIDISSVEKDHVKRIEKHNIGYYLKQIKPWKKNGGHILVCPSSDLIQSVMLQEKINEGEWLHRTINKLKKYTDRPIRVRHKKIKDVKITLQEDLKGAFACVTFASVAGVEALNYGVPSFCHALSPASPLSLHDLSMIEKPIYPDNRDVLTKTLLLNQFNDKEFYNGTAWNWTNQ